MHGGTWSPESLHTAVPAARMLITETPPRNERLSVAEASSNQRCYFILYSLRHNSHRFPHASPFARLATLSCTRNPLATSRAPLGHPAPSLATHLCSPPTTAARAPINLLSASFPWKRHLSHWLLAVTIGLRSLNFPPLVIQSMLESPCIWISRPMDPHGGRDHMCTCVRIQMSSQAAAGWAALAFEFAFNSKQEDAACASFWA